MTAINVTIRQLKDGADSTSTTLLQIQDASGAINGVRGIVDQANEKINQTTQMVNGIRQVGEQKIEQVQKTADSIKKAGEAINEVQNNLNSLTTLSGSTSMSGEVNVTKN
jgi:methyl-accepting chemotaxis protein